MSNLDEIPKSEGSSLSAEQLIQLGWHRDTSLPMRGVKDYAPCGSWMENKAHQVTFRERAELLAEERVAKLGILAKGEWKPAMKKVQLVKNKKKFWQSMGYSEDGKEFFQPEEALFLLDAGVLEIYYGGVPLSVQQAYSTLLHCDLTMEQYQVFALLSRYGFILRRHNPDLRVTEYERKIKLNQFLKSKPKSKKRNRHPLETVMGEDELEQVDVPIKVSKVGDVGVECWAGDSECRTVIGESRKTPPLSSVCGCVEADDTELRAPVRTRTPELPVESPEQTTTSEQPLESPEQTTILEIPAKSPEWTKTPELPVESPERTTTSEQPLESLEQTTIPEIPVGSPEQTTPPNLAVATPELTSTDELTVETSERTTNSKLSLKRTQHTAASELLVEIPERNLICDSPVATPHETKPVTVPKKPDKDELRPTSRVPYSKWDWTKVTLPNIANKSCLVLQKPNPDLLPCCVLYGKDTYTFDLSSFVWSRRPEKMWEFSLGGTSWKRNIQASNWGDYRKQYQKYVSEYSLETSPAGHLWRSDVTPLIKPQDAISTASILQKLQIIESVQLSFPQHISDGGCADRSVSFRVMFDVFLPNTRFKKTAELCPHHHLCIVRSADRLPSMGETLALARHCYPGVPLHFAVVDGGDINFYIFHDIKLPTKLDVK